MRERQRHRLAAQPPQAMLGGLASIRFRGRLEEARGGGELVMLPPEVVEKLGGGRARIPVKGTVQGHAFRYCTMPMGDGRHCIGIYKAVRMAELLELGDMVQIDIERDSGERAVDVPADLARALDAERGLRGMFDSLSYTTRKELARGVEEAKKAETRQRRIEAALAVVHERRTKSAGQVSAAGS